MSRAQTGKLGEEAAARYLMERGMRLLTTRYRAARGEVDLVLLDGDCLVFAEVKYRPQGARGEGAAAVTPAKRRRIVSAAQSYLAAQGEMDRPARFDVVEITREGVWHLPNAFTADER